MGTSDIMSHGIGPIPRENAIIMPWDKNNVVRQTKKSLATRSSTIIFYALCNFKKDVPQLQLLR